MLRHTFVTLARRAGNPLDDLQDAVGHADPATIRHDDSTLTIRLSGFSRP